MNEACNAPSLPPVRDLENDDLLLAFQAGREGCFPEIHRRFHGLLLSIANKMVGNGDAEDLVQNVYLTLLQTGCRFDPAKSCAATWISGIARRRGIDFLRKRSRKIPAVPLERSDGSGGWSLPLDHDRVLAVPTPDEVLIAKETRRIIEDALADAPAGTRESVELLMEEIPFPEIAQRTGDPVATVKTRVRRWRMKVLEGSLGELLKRGPGA